MSNVTRLKIQQEHCKTLIERYKAYNRLKENDDFKKLFLQDYCITHCVNSIQSSLNTLLSEEDRKLAIAKAQATRFFNQYLKLVVSEGEQAFRDYEDLEYEILKMR